MNRKIKIINTNFLLPKFPVKKLQLWAYNPLFPGEFSALKREKNNAITNQ